MLNNAKPYFLLNEMNKKDLPAMYSTVFWCLFVILLAFLALLCNQNTVEYIAGKAFLFMSFNKVRFSKV